MYNTIEIGHEKNRGLAVSIKGLRIIDPSIVMGSVSHDPPMVFGGYRAVRKDSELERSMEILGVISRLEAGVRNSFREPRELAFSESMIEGYGSGINRFKERYYRGLAAIPRAIAASYDPKRKPERVARKALKTVIGEYLELREFESFIEDYINHMVEPIKRN